MADLIRVEKEGSVIRLILNNPKQRNPLSNAMIEALIRCFEMPEVKEAGIIVLSGAGSDFCAGGDINDFRDIIDATAAEQWEACERFRYMLAAMHGLTPVIVAVVRGRALGGGCGLVAACDFAIASESAQFGTPEIKIGAFPMVIAPALTAAMGVRRTMHLSTTGQSISAAMALDYGLVQQVVADENFDTEVNAFCTRVAKASSSALRVGKSTVRSCAEASYSSGLEIGMSMRSILFSSPEFQKGIEGFLTPRK